jgi:hypothetical protein
MFCVCVLDGFGYKEYDFSTPVKVNSFSTPSSTHRIKREKTDKTEKTNKPTNQQIRQRTKQRMHRRDTTLGEDLLGALEGG